MSTLILQRTRSCFDRWCDALLDPARRERTVAIALAAYTALWTLYAVLAKSSQDVHFDMGEAVAWSREVTFGAPKHPPLTAWLSRAWFAVFPQADWAYYLLGVTLAALSLWIAWRVSARYLDDGKRVAGLALLSLVPFYNFHALKYNANLVMLPTWALATLWFLRSYATRRPVHAALAGVGAAVAMLAKYWSIILLVGLAAAALFDPRRRAYFVSSAPWITVAAGTAVLAPHIAWLYVDGFSTFGYALESHAAGLSAAAMSGLGYLGGVAGYIAPAVILGVIATRPSLAATVDTLAPSEPERRQVLIAWAVPLLLPVLAALAFREAIVSLWAISAMTLLPVVMLSSPQLTVSRAAVRGVIAVAVVFPLACLAAAPIAAIVTHRLGLPHHATHYRLVARAVEQAWRNATDRPLTFLGGAYNLLFSTAFYIADRPSSVDIVNPRLTPWADEARVGREGIAIVCASEDSLCIAQMEARAGKRAAARRTDVDIVRRHLGIPGAPARYVITIVPPQP